MELRDTTSALTATEAGPTLSHVKHMPDTVLSGICSMETRDVDFMPGSRDRHHLIFHGYDILHPQSLS